MSVKSTTRQSSRCNIASSGNSRVRSGIKLRDPLQKSSGLQVILLIILAVFVVLPKSSDQCGKGGSSDVDVRTFWCKNHRVFRNLWRVHTDGGL